VDFFTALCSQERRAMEMGAYVTVSDLLQYTLVLIGLAGVIISYINGKKK
jgi:hypothetical protein